MQILHLICTLIKLQIDQAHSVKHVPYVGTWSCQIGDKLVGWFLSYAQICDVCKLTPLLHTLTAK